MVAHVSCSVAGRSGGRVMPCAVCTVHVETRSTDFLVDPQNQSLRFVSGLASKPLGWFVIGLTSKPLGRFISGLTSKPLGRFISDLASKSLGRFLPVWPQNRGLWVSRFGPQNRQLQFGDLNLKITVTVYWFEPQNQVGMVCRLRRKTDGRMRWCGTCVKI
jgi:hypothetical protein